MSAILIFPLRSLLLGSLNTPSFFLGVRCEESVKRAGDCDRLLRPSLGVRGVVGWSAFCFGGGLGEFAGEFMGEASIRRSKSMEFSLVSSSFLSCEAVMMEMLLISRLGRVEVFGGC